VTATLELLRSERRARRFFAAYAQSALGNGAGYVALVVIAYQRWHSPWAITFVLMADFIPAMVLGPVFGAAADRWSRRRVAVAADLMRAIAFIGIALVGGIWATVALALLAGTGAGLFTPAILAALPSLVEERRLPAATSLYGGLTDAGRTVGPALAAVAIALTSAQAVVVANGATFLLSALVLAAMRFGDRTAPAEEGGEPGLLRQAREGVTTVARMPGIKTLVLASSGVILFSAMMNVAELLLARSLHAGNAGYSVLVAIFGIGFVVGSLSGAGGAPVPELKRRYLLGILLIGAGLVVAIVPSFPVAALGLALAGLGNGVTLVNERLICQRVVPDSMLARAFAVFDTAGSWAFGIAFVGAGAVLSLTGVRPLLLVAGLGSVGIWALSCLALRRVWNIDVGEPEPVQPVQEPEAEVLERVPDGPLPPPATAAGAARVEPASALAE
jgi:MFS family permease